MFVRWKRHKRGNYSRTSRRRNDKRGDSLRACLVRNSRSGPRVRQQVIGYLGSIDEKVTDRLHERAFFWRYAGPRLSALNLSDDDRAQVERQISEKVPQLSAEETAEYEAEYQRIAGGAGR